MYKRQALDLAALDSDVVIQLGPGVDANINVNNVETITANAMQSNTIIADNRFNRWVISGVNTGTIEDAISPTSESTVRFENFKNITGGAGDDNYIHLNSGSITGVIDGGSHTVLDFVDYSALDNVTVHLGGAAGSIANIERIIGNDVSSTLVAADGVNNTWTITGVNDGDVAGVVFVDFNLLQGGDQQDIFNVNAGSATIMGGAGDDILRVSLTGTQIGHVSFDGEGHNAGDTVELIGGSSGYVGDFFSNVTGAADDQFLYTNGGNTFTVTYTNSETVLDDLLANTLRINGTVSADTIDLLNQAFTVNGARTVGYTSSRKTNLIVDGRESDDVINIQHNFSVTDALTLTSETLSNT